MKCTHPLIRSLTALLLAAGTATAVAASFELPALVTPASTEHHPGKMIWADLVTPDVGAAEKFYAGMFGWTFQDMHGAKHEYAIAYLDSRPIAGLIQRETVSGEEHHSGWLSFLAVSDVAAAEQTALAHGAKLLREPRTYPHRGTQAVLADPDGAVFALLASESGDPPDVLAEPGQWIWSSIHVQNAGTEAAFYQTVFGYEVYDLASDDGSEHAILSSDGYARASLNGFPKDAQQHHPHWLNFIRVADADSMAAKAVTLGGKVLVEPRVDRHGDKIAVVADPTGAAIGLMEWSDAKTQQVQP